jgi:putative hemolysin
MDLLILLILFLLNGLFAMSEIAIASARKSRLTAEARRGDRNALSALKLSEKPSRFLSTVQIGITVVGILTGIFSGQRIAADVDHWLQVAGVPVAYSANLALTLVVAVVSFFSLILGELVPKRLGLARPEFIAKVMAHPMTLLSRLAAPFIWVLSGVTDLLVRLLGIRPNSADAVTEEEIKAILSEGTEAGAIEEIEQDIVENVFHLGDRRIGSLMTPRIDIAWLDLDRTVAENKQRIKQSIHSMFPVCTGDLDKIAGVVHVKDLLAAEFNEEAFDLKKHLRTPLYFPENIKAFKVLEKFNETGVHFAAVVDEFGSVAGLVTMNDLLEAIVGDVEEEFEKEKEIVARPDGSYIVDASVPFPDFVRYFEIELTGEEERHEFNTVGGLVFSLARTIPATGARYGWKGYMLEVLDLDGRRIDKLLVKKEEAVEQAD